MCQSLVAPKKNSSPEINNSLLVAGAHIASHTVAILMHLMEIVAATQSNSVHEQMLHTSSHAPTISKSKSGITNLSCLHIGYIGALQPVDPLQHQLPGLGNRRAKGGDGGAATAIFLLAKIQLKHGRTLWPWESHQVPEISWNLGEFSNLYNIWTLIIEHLSLVEFAPIFRAAGASASQIFALDHWRGRWMLNYCAAGHGRTWLDFLVTFSGFLEVSGWQPGALSWKMDRCNRILVRVGPVGGCGLWQLEPSLKNSTPEEFNSKPICWFCWGFQAFIVKFPIKTY